MSACECAAAAMLRFILLCFPGCHHNHQHHLPFASSPFDTSSPSLGRGVGVAWPCLQEPEPSAPPCGPGRVYCLLILIPSYVVDRPRKTIRQSVAPKVVHLHHMWVVECVSVCLDDAWSVSKARVSFLVPSFGPFSLMTLVL
jgi:hypothetical protein